mmetsp:Transcript_66196/g.96919  ORF Transcript_66196/g.96919 Transcript_66196/m.96919 type:complete len:135 (-) Transcript_66196:281-685(-)
MECEHIDMDWCARTGGSEAREMERLRIGIDRCARIGGSEVTEMERSRIGFVGSGGFSREEFANTERGLRAGFSDANSAGGIVGVSVLSSTTPKLSLEISCNDLRISLSRASCSRGGRAVRQYTGCSRGGRDVQQ